MSAGPEALAERLTSRFSLPPAQTNRLVRLLALLATSEAPTSVKDPARAVDVHIADSLAGLEVQEIRAAGLIADIGSGAGLPGLVLATVVPEARVVLVESVGRKCDFLRKAASELELGNVDVVAARVEEWHEGRERCDVVAARALAALPVLAEYAAPLLRPGGVLVAWKGAVGHEEAADARAAAEHLGLAPDRARSVVPYTGSERRTLHVLRKIKPTPPRFPRRPGIATKRPLSAKTLP
jgi:16S rRNA (guanine527-N7)-methyltransferase